MVLLSGVLSALSMPPFGWWFCSLFCWVPILLLISKWSPRQSLLMGWCASYCALLVMGSDFPYSLHGLLGGAPALSYFLGYAYFAYLSLQTALMLFTTTLLLKRQTPIVVAFPLAWLATDTLFPAPLKFSLAYSVYDVPLLIQIAELGGEKLVGIGLLCVNGLLAALIVERKQLGFTRYWRLAQLSTITALCCMILFGLLRLHGFSDTQPKITAGIMHLNGEPLPIGTRKRQQFLTDLIHTAAKGAKQRSFDIYPETILNLSQTLRVKQHRFPATSIVGATSLFESQDKDVKIHRTANSALLLINDDVSGRYDKQNLLLGGEYLPQHPLLWWLRDLFPNAGAHKVSAQYAQPLSFEGHKLLVLICYDEMLGDFVARQMRTTPSQVLIGLSSGSAFQGNAETLLHRASARFRAVETRRYFLRSTRGGWSEVIDPQGRVRASADAQSATQLIKAKFSYHQGQTLYMLWGDLPWKAATALLLIFLVLPRVNKLQQLRFSFRVLCQAIKVNTKNPPPIKSRK